MLIYILLLFILIILISAILLFNNNIYKGGDIYDEDDTIFIEENDENIIPDDIYETSSIYSNKMIYSGDMPSFANRDMKQTMEKIGWKAACPDSKIIHFSFDNKNAILYGQISQLGIDFSDKKKLEKHFLHKHYFPKWNSKISSGVYICKSINSHNSHSHDSHSHNILISKDSKENIDNCAITKYIENPLLYNEKKFNLQIFIALCIRGGTSKYKQLEQAIIFPFYNMLCASQPYKNADYDNRDIHISNKETDILEEEMKKRNKYISELDIMPQIYEIIHDCEKISNAHIVNNTSFELLTLDVIIDENKKVWIMDMHRTLEAAATSLGKAFFKGVSTPMAYEDWLLYNVIMANFGLHKSVYQLNKYKSLKSKQIIIPDIIKTQKTMVSLYAIKEQLTLTPLYLANEEELKELAIIGSIQEVYKYISHGHKKWDDGYIRKLFKEAIADSAQLCRDYYHWILVYNNHCVGYIGIRPYDDAHLSYPNVTKCIVATQLKAPPIINENRITKKKPIMVKGEINCYQLRYFISPDYRGKSFAAIAGIQVVHFFKSIYPTKNLFANILKTNITSIKTAENIGLHKIDSNADYLLYET